MPINLKKTNIEYDVDSPKEGYITLGFDPNGDLVYKDSDGTYGKIIPAAGTEDSTNIRTDYLTVGHRKTDSLADWGLYSIGQGANVEASGSTSFARGNFVTASGDYSFVSGVGVSNTVRLESNGTNSFVHSYATVSSGTLSDYSVILGGRNHNIGSASNNSIILGGDTNTIDNSLYNVSIIGATDYTATISDSVHMPRLVLIDGSYTGPDVAGLIEWDGTNFKGYNGISWVNLDSGDYLSLSGGTLTGGLTGTTIYATNISLSNITTKRVPYKSDSGLVDSPIIISGGTTMFVGINSPFGEPKSRFEVVETSIVGSSPGDYQRITTMGSTGGVSNYVMNDLYGVRDVSGNTWETYVLHDSISVDVSYLTPRLDTKTWWERNPTGGTHSWGNEATTYMSLSNTGLTLSTGGLVVGGVTISGSTGYATDWVATSDINLKENIKPIDNALSNILKLSGVTFNFINDENKIQRSGLIAQDLEKVYPDMVITNNDGYKNISYLQLISVLIESVKEQQEQIDILKQDIDYLKNN